MIGSVLASVSAVLFVLTFVAWRRYLWAAESVPDGQADTCPYSLTEVFGDRHLVNVPHQEGVQWLTEIFSRSARKYPDHTALQIPHTGESLTFAELDARAENVAAALSPFLTGPDQVVAVAMAQDNWQIVASHLGILKAGGTVMFLDTTLPEALITHMLEDAQPVVVLTRGQDSFRDLPTLDVLALPENGPRSAPPPWLDDPTQRLATLFYTSGTTGMPKGVECPHAGYVNLALSYADYFDLVPGMDATSLTSSLGYDGSISEMYSAWVSGCAVVMLTKEQMRSGPDLVPVLREAEVTVLFCPPVLLTTLTPNPELDLPYPLCRYIVPAGEAFPGALVEPWTRGRRQIINTYGPTEASTDTSRQSLRPGEPVTIGSPLANVTYVILEVGQLARCLTGRSVSSALAGCTWRAGTATCRSRPPRSSSRTLEFGRLYRTGDQCRIDIRTQRVHFLGRVDAQLKVRGHRVEIQAVEDILQTQFGEIEAAVLDYQNQELVAFVAAPSVSGGDDLGGRSGTGGVGGPGHGDPGQTTSGAVGPDEDLPGEQVRHEAGVREDRPGAAARPVASADKRRAGSGGSPVEARPTSKPNTEAGKARLGRIERRNRAVRRCWRSAGTCSKLRWDGTTYSSTMAGTRSSSRDWRSVCGPQGGWCRSGRLLSDCDTATKGGPSPAGAPAGLPMPPRLPRTRTRPHRAR